MLAFKYKHFAVIHIFTIVLTSNEDRDSLARGEGENVPAEAASTETEKPTVAPKDTKVIKVPGVQLEIPLGKDVIIRIPGVEQSYRGTIVGYDPYDFIIARVRLPSKVREGLSFGGQLIVKYVNQGAVYGFKAAVHNSITSPASLVFFSYPAVIEKIALRRTSRADCNIDGLLQTLDSEHECLVVNVSETGCKISARAGTRDPITATKVDETMMVSMTLGHFGTLKLPIAIRNLSLEKGILSIGGMFLDIKKDEVKIINQYLEKMARFSR